MENTLLLTLMFFTLCSFSHTPSYVTTEIPVGFFSCPGNVEIQNSTGNNLGVNLYFLDTYRFLSENNTNSFDELDD